MQPYFRPAIFMNKSKIFLFVIICTGLFSSLFAQNTATLSVLSGGNVQFNFLKYNDYLNGLVLNDATVLGISVTENGGPAINGFHIEVSTVEDQFYGGGIVPRTLPLNSVQVEAENLLGLPGGAENVYAAPTDLTQYTVSPPFNVNPTIMTHLPAVWADTDYTTHQITLTYTAGVTSGYLSEEEDMYIVNMYIDLVVDN